MAEFYDFGVGGFDVRFDLPALTTNAWVMVWTDTVVQAEDMEALTPGSAVLVMKTSTGYRLALYGAAGTDIDRFNIEHPSGAARLQVTTHNDAFSVFIDGRWMHTFFATYVHYEVIPAVEIRTSASMTISNVVVTELFDSRDRVSIDLQSSLANAISSILGQKPICQWADYNGLACYAYDPPADTGTVYRATAFERRRSLPGNAASDVVVMHNQTVVLADLEALEQFGLMTQLVRLPDLGAGAIRVGLHVLEAGRQEAERYTADGPIDPSIEMYDQVTVQVMTPGGQVAYEKSMVVDTLQYTGGAHPKMHIEGNQV